MSEDTGNAPLNGRMVVIFMCLAASSLTLILSIFSIYFMMCSGSETAKEESKQEVSTDMELKPLCLHRQ